MGQQPPSDKSRLERRKDETRQKIVGVALKLFRKNGFEAVTMETIAETADVAKGTLYNYFPVKEAILDEYIRESFKVRDQERAAEMQKLPNTVARMKSAFSELLTGIQSQKLIFEKYIVYRMQHWISFNQEEHEKSGFQAIASEIVRLGQSNNELRNDLPAGMLEDLCEYVFMLAVKEFYLSPETFNTSQAIQRSVDIFLNGTKK